MPNVAGSHSGGRAVVEVVGMGVRGALGEGGAVGAVGAVGAIALGARSATSVSVGPVDGPGLESEVTAMTSDTTVPTASAARFHRPVVVGSTWKGRRREPCGSSTCAR